MIKLDNMPYRKIKFQPGNFYHVYNRGYARQNIFFSDHDRYRFLQAIYLANNEKSFRSISELERNKSSYTLLDMEKMLTEEKIYHSPLVDIYADCLMPNHFHFLIKEIKENGVAKFMQKLGSSYARYFSIKYNKPGSIFQGRFKAVQISNDEQLKYLILYINAINPAQISEPNLKTEGIKNLENVFEAVSKYKWSSHPEFCGIRKSILINFDLANELFSSVDVYKEFIRDFLSGRVSVNKNFFENFGIEEQ